MGFGILDIVTVLVLFRVTASLAGFSIRRRVPDDGARDVGFALADVLVGNVERLRLYVRTGPARRGARPPARRAVQLVAIDVAPRRIGRVVFSLVVLVVAVAYAT